MNFFGVLQGIKAVYPVLKAKGVLPEGITGKTHEEESLPPSAYLAFRWRRKTNDSSNFFSGRLLSHINKSELKSRGYIAKLSVKPQNHTLGRPNVSLERVNFVLRTQVPRRLHPLRPHPLRGGVRPAPPPRRGRGVRRRGGRERRIRRE